MKKFMVRCDIEGASGVVSYDQAEPGKSEYEIGRSYFMSDLIALIEGLKEGGADEVHIYDEHCAGRNILLDRLPAKKGVFVYAGKPLYLAKCPGGLDDSFEGLILLGFHSKRGSKGCLLNHTYEPDLADILVNGTSVGEIGMEALLAADFGVPLVMVTADSAGIAEARAFGTKNCEYVCVKESLGEYGARVYPLGVTADMIREAAKRAAIRSYIRTELRGNARIELRFFDTPFAARYRKKYESELLGDTISALWCEYQRRKTEIAAELAGE